MSPEPESRRAANSAPSARCATRRLTPRGQRGARGPCQCHTGEGVHADPLESRTTAPERRPYSASRRSSLTSSRGARSRRSNDVGAARHALGGRPAVRAAGTSLRSRPARVAEDVRTRAPLSPRGRRSQTAFFSTASSVQDPGGGGVHALVPVSQWTGSAEGSPRSTLSIVPGRLLVCARSTAPALGPCHRLVEPRLTSLDGDDEPTTPSFSAPCSTPSAPAPGGGGGLLRIRPTRELVTTDGRFDRARGSGGMLESSAGAGPSIHSIGSGSPALRRIGGRAAVRCIGGCPVGCGRIARRPRASSKPRTRSLANVADPRAPRPSRCAPPGSQRNASRANAAAATPHTTITSRCAGWIAPLPVAGLNADSRSSANGRSGSADAIARSQCGALSIG